MSAQVIAALRKRADVLEAGEMPREVHGPVSGLQKWLAAEFRALADEAEGLNPGAPEGEQDEWPP